MVVVRRTKGGSYVLAELTGAVSSLRYAAFRLYPYHARTKISTPLHNLVDDANLRDDPDDTSETVD